MRRIYRQRGWRLVVPLICALVGLLISGYLYEGAITTTTLRGCLVVVTGYSVGLVLRAYVFASDVPPPPPRHAPHDESP